MIAIKIAKLGNISRWNRSSQVHNFGPWTSAAPAQCFLKIPVALVVYLGNHPITRPCCDVQDSNASSHIEWLKVVETVLQTSWNSIDWARAGDTERIPNMSTDVVEFNIVKLHGIFGSNLPKRWTWQFHFAILSAHLTPDAKRCQDFDCKQSHTKTFTTSCIAVFSIHFRSCAAIASNTA